MIGARSTGVSFCSVSSARGPWIAICAYAVARVFDGAIELVVRGDVLVILVLIGRVHAQEEMIVGDLVDQDVVDETAVLVEQPGIVRLADLQLRGGVGRDVIDQLQRFRPANFDLAHVADVEQAHALAHGVVLIDDAGVVDRHVPAAEIDHLRAHSAMGRR